MKKFLSKDKYDMKRSEIFDIILGIVLDVCEVTEEEVVNKMKKTQDCIDARILVVYYCRQAGLTSYEIAKAVVSRTGDPVDDQYVFYKAKGIDKMYYSYLDRIHDSISFGLNDDDIYIALKDKYSEIFKPGMKKFPNRR